MTDFNIINGGSIVMFVPISEAACTWVDEHIGRDNGYQPYYPTFIAEPGYVDDIVTGIRRDGLLIR